MKVWKYGDDVNTDMLFPGKYTYTCSTPDEIKPHLLEDLDAEFATGVAEGDVIFAGSNFGCGSSREQPALGLKAVGLQAIVAKGFSRIFFRASTNQGLLLIECAEAVEAFKPDASVEINAVAGTIKVGETVYTFPKLPRAMMDIMEAGGLLPYTKKKLAARD